ncbi:hypothetical protein [Altericista sp. CCNU0014]|uniref:hypothetical protein n=1 Tax=Altericista sp. CCNU0014 TaxID=3082949 RepID=UPI003850B6AB
MNSKSISLVVFTCEGREHLLNKTLASAEQRLEYDFSKRILAVDGNIDFSQIDQSSFDTIIRVTKRSGYINSIIYVNQIVRTDFFFWLEDDWHFLEIADLEYLVTLLRQNPEWVQIRFSKTGPLNEHEKQNKLCEGVYDSVYGFSANPCLCRTDLIRKGFQSLQQESRDENLGFETFLSQWFEDQKLICAVLDPGEKAAIQHLGYLESTPRQWHMTASLDGKTDKYLSGMRGSPSPPLWRKILMAYKLIWTFVRVLLCQFMSREAYDLAFRFIAASKEVKN